MIFLPWVGLSALAQPRLTHGGQPFLVLLRSRSPCQQTPMAMPGIAIKDTIRA
jgi:hypothetical protein